MKRQKNIKAFVIRKKDVWDNKRLFENIKNSAEDEKITKQDAEIIIESVKEQLK